MFLAPRSGEDRQPLRGARTAFGEAFSRAASGLDWSYPCLIWIADYLKAETGRDPAAGFRHVAWNEAGAKASLARLAVAGEGQTAVERTLDFIAKRDGWQARDGAQQGACMIAVFNSFALCPSRPNGREAQPLGPDDPTIGIPAIFDGWRGWLVCYFGVATILRGQPVRIWEVAR